MAEKHHVKTTPNEHVAPEYPEGGVKHVDGGHAQADDINVALVGVIVLFFAAFLLVSVVALQAMFYNQAGAETEGKTASQGAPSTELGKASADWDKLLHANGAVDNVLAPPKNGQYPKVTVKPIDVAMQDVIKKYGGKNAGEPQVERR